MSTMLMLFVLGIWPPLDPPSPSPWPAVGDVQQYQTPVVIKEQEQEEDKPEVVKLLKPPLSPDELRAIDERFMQKNHYRLCPGSCGMMCAAHGGGWRLETGPANPDDPNQKPAPDTPASGHWEQVKTKCGPNGCEYQRVWVSDKVDQVVQPVEVVQPSELILDAGMTGVVPKVRVFKRRR